MDDPFGLKLLSDSMEQTKQLTARKQQLSMQQLERTNAANQKIAEIQRNSSKVSQDLVTDLMPAMDRVSELEAAAQKQESLKSSGEFGGFLEFVGNQVLDPSKYTREGRSKALAETNSFMSVKTNIASLRQAALADLSKTVEVDLATSGAELSIASLQEQQAEERIQSEILKIQQKGQMLQNSRVLAAEKLATMSTEDIKVAAQKSGGKPIDIGGVMIQPLEMQKRLDEINEREYQTAVNAAALQSKNNELADKAKDKMLNTFSIPELRQIVKEGSEVFNLDSVNKVLQIKEAAFTEENQRIRMAFENGDIGTQVLGPAVDEVNRAANSIPERGQLNSAYSAYKQTIAIVSQTLTAAQEQNGTIPIELSAAAAESIQKAKDTFNESIKLEAKLKSNGDGNLETIYLETFQGNPVPKAAAEAAISERLVKNRPLNDIFPEQVAKAIKDTYLQQYQEAVKGSAFTPGFDKDVAKQEAMQAAIDYGIKSGMQDRTMDLYLRPVSDPTSPLYGVLSPTQTVSMTAAADEKGIKAFQSTYGLSDDEMNSVLMGNPVEGKVSIKEAQDLLMIQNQELFTELDMNKSGLARQHVEWWESNVNSYTDKLSKTRSEAAKVGDVKDAIFQSYAGDLESDQIQQYVISLRTAFDSYNNAKENRYRDMVTFDMNANHRQAMLLELDDSLTDAEKATFMKEFVLPTIQKGKEAKLPFDEINIAVERAIEANIAPNPTVAKLLKKVSSNRAKAAGIIEKFQDSITWRKDKTSPRMGGSVNRWGARSTGRLDWYQEIMKE